MGDKLYLDWTRFVDEKPGYSGYYVYSFNHREGGSIFYSVYTSQHEKLLAFHHDYTTKWAMLPKGKNHCSIEIQDIATPSECAEKARMFKQRN